MRFGGWMLADSHPPPENAAKSQDWRIWVNNIRGNRSLILQRVGTEKHRPVRRMSVGNLGLILRA